MTESLEKDIHLTESRQKTELDATKKVYISNKQAK